jgi:hypothetical protein
MPELPAIVDAAPTRAIDHSDGIDRRRLLLAIPAVGFAGLAGLLAWGLGRDPSRLLSTLVGKEAPKFACSAWRTPTYWQRFRSSMCLPPGVSPAGPSIPC